MNQVVLVGRLTKDLEIKELEDGKKVCNITLAVSRPFKNSEGIYETDFIDCTLWNEVAVRTAEYMHKGDVVGLRGRLEMNSYEKDDKKVSKLSVVSDKVTFLTSHREQSDKEAEAR